MKFYLIVPFFLILTLTLIIRVEGINDQGAEQTVRIQMSNPADNPSDSFSSTNDLTAKNNFLDCQLSNGASAALIKNLSNNAILFEFNGSHRWPIASLTKLATSLIAFENIPADEEIELRDGKNIQLFKVRDLIKAMLIISSNEAAGALAEHLGENNFVGLMNKKAGELGMTETAFFNSSGLSLLNQSTASDLAKLTAYLYFNYPELFKISRWKETKILELKTNTTKELSNINLFARRMDFLGGKSGYLENAGRNLISLFNKDNQTILIIVLGAKDAHAETEALLSCLEK